MKTACNPVTDVTGGTGAPQVAASVGPRSTLPARPAHTRSGEQVDRADVAVPRYEPTENEQASLRKFEARRAARAPVPTLKVKKNGKAPASLRGSTPIQLRRKSCCWKRSALPRQTSWTACWNNSPMHLHRKAR